MACLVASPQPDVDGAGPAMLACRVVVAADQRTEGRRGKPGRNRTLQHAFAAERSALAGDHQDVTKPAGMRPMQERQEQAVRLALRHAVQVDAGIDLQAALGQLVSGLLVERVRTWLDLALGALR